MEEKRKLYWSKLVDADSSFRQQYGEGPFEETTNPSGESVLRPATVFVKAGTYRVSKLQKKDRVLGMTCMYFSLTQNGEPLEPL